MQLFHWRFSPFRGQKQRKFKTCLRTSIGAFSIFSMKSASGRYGLDMDVLQVWVGELTVEDELYQNAIEQRLVRKPFRRYCSTVGSCAFNRTCGTFTGQSLQGHAAAAKVFLSYLSKSKESHNKL